MKRITLIIIVIISITGCNSSKTNNGQWHLYGGFKTKGNASSKQLIYFGEKKASYRITCNKSSSPVDIIRNTNKITTIVAGQSVDVDGINIEVQFSTQSSKNPRASGTYRRIVIKKTVTTILTE